MSEKQSEISVVVNEAGLEPSKVKTIIEQFEGFIKSGEEWKEKALAIKIEDISQIEDMKKAREIRLELKDIRVNAEKVRVNLKEQSIREGKAIDGVANIIKALIVPLEKHLEDQEKFAERKEAERKQAIYDKRVAELSRFVPDVSMYNIKEMSEDVFVALLANSEDAFKKRQEAEKKAEQDRIAKEKAEAEENERIRKENEQLKKDEEKRKEDEARIKKEADDKVATAQAEQKKAEDALKKKAEDEARAKKDEEDRLAREKVAKEEEERQAKLAPEKDKLLVLAKRIHDFNIGEVATIDGLSEKGKNFVEKIEQSLNALEIELRNNVKNL